jgi:hypothetical protein
MTRSTADDPFAPHPPTGPIGAYRYRDGAAPQGIGAGAGI